MAPAPMAITTRAICAGVVKPRAVSIGARIPAVVVMATVEEPWADFRMAAKMKGNKIPMLSNTVAFSVIKATKLVDAIILPKTPPEIGRAHV